MKSYWVCVPEWKLAVAAPPKCGSRSVLITIVKYFYPGSVDENVRPSEYKKKTQFYRYVKSPSFCGNWQKMAIIRNPIDRFASLWSHHCRDGIPGIPLHLRNNATQYELLDFIRSNLGADPHWACQSDIIGKHSDITFCRLDQASKCWDRMTPDTVPALDHVNQTASKATISDEIKNQLKQIYSEDFLLWENCNEKKD